MTTHVVPCAVVAALVAALAAPVALGQARPREVTPEPAQGTLREVTPEQTQGIPREITPEPAQGTSSQEMNSVLDLAKIYFSQGRYEEAQGMLARAQGIVARMRTTATPIDATASLSTALPQGVVRIGGNVKPPSKIHNVDPIYPREAKAAKVQGLVIIEAIIDTQGNVTDARVLRGVQLLDGPALDAVRQWQFTPTLMNGVPIAVAMTVTVNFKLAE
jgi:TonB family protein